MTRRDICIRIQPVPHQECGGTFSFKSFQSRIFESSDPVPLLRMKICLRSNLISAKFAQAPVSVVSLMRNSRLLRVCHESWTALDPILLLNMVNDFLFQDPRLSLLWLISHEFCVMKFGKIAKRLDVKQYFLHVKHIQWPHTVQIET